MRIKRKLESIMLLALLLGATLATAFLAAQRWETSINGQAQLASDITEQAFRLSLVGHEFYMHSGGLRAAEQWFKTSDELGQIIQKADFQGTEKRAPLQRIEDTRKRLTALFTQLLKLTTDPLKPALVEEQQRRLNDQINFTVQTMTSEALSLQHYLRQEASLYRRNINRLLVGLAVILTGAITLLAYLAGSSITRPLLRLRQGTAVVGAGDLNYRVGTTARDEIGELSRDFDTMLYQLQQVTASREELAREVERRIRTETALRKSEESLKIAQAIAHLGHWEWEIKSDQVKWSDETYRILGYEPKAVEPSHALLLQQVHPDDREAIDACLKGAVQGECFDAEFRIVLADGTPRTVHARGEVLRESAIGEPRFIGTIQEVGKPGPMEILGVIQDITERKELESKLEQEAHTDELTGCANRRHFIELSTREMARARRYDHDLSLLMIDIDHFKNINDHYGHHVGDLALKRLVQICQEELREEDLVGRLGGEEFAILLPETGNAKAVEVAERIRAAIAAARIRSDGKTIHITISIGVSTQQRDDTDIDALLNRADSALYAAKTAGRNRVRSSLVAVEREPAGV